MDVTDEELLRAEEDLVTDEELCALREEDVMNSDEDEELCAALERVGVKMDKTWWKKIVVRKRKAAGDTTTTPRGKKEWWQLPPDHVRDLMSNRREMTELYELIDDCAPRPIHRWPDVVTDYFYGLEPLKWQGRFIVAAFFWYNGMNPELAVEWLKFMGAFCPPNERRERQMRDTIKALKENMKSSSGRASLQRWYAFDLQTFKWARCWYPSDEMLRGLGL